MQDIQKLLAAVPDECMGRAARRASRAITNHFNDKLRALDLNVAQYGLLVAVGRDPDRTLAAMAASMGLDESTLTRNLAILQRRGLVAAEGGRGRAGKRIRLTSEGIALVRRAVLIWRRANRQLTQAFGAAELERGRAFLARVETAAETAREAKARKT